MDQVRQWIDGFFKRHRARFDPHDWPNGDDTEDSREFLLGWITAFATRRVAEAEADEASRLLAETPPNYRREHLPAVLAMVDAQRQRRGATAPGAARAQARDASRGCAHCSGEGLATVYHPRPDPARRIPATVAAYCVCPHGRWIKRAHAEKSPEMLRAIPDLEDVLQGGSEWLPDPTDTPMARAPSRPAPALARKFSTP